MNQTVVSFGPAFFHEEPLALFRADFMHTFSFLNRFSIYISMCVCVCLYLLLGKWFVLTGAQQCARVAADHFSLALSLSLFKRLYNIHTRTCWLYRQKQANYQLRDGRQRVGAPIIIVRSALLFSQLAALSVDLDKCRPSIRPSIQRQENKRETESHQRW